MNEQLLTIKEAALCFQITERAIYYRINIGKLEYTRINNERIRIPLKNLPKEAQARYWKLKQPFNLTEAEVYKLLTVSQLEEVMKKLLAVTMYRTYLATHASQNCCSDFFKGFNERYSYINVDEPKLKSWFDKFNTFGVAGLAEEFLLYAERADSA